MCKSGYHQNIKLLNIKRRQIRHCTHRGGSAHTSLVVHTNDRMEFQTTWTISYYIECVLVVNMICY